MTLTWIVEIVNCDILHDLYYNFSKTLRELMNMNFVSSITSKSDDGSRAQQRIKSRN